MNQVLTTTLRLVREHHACEERYAVLVAALGPGWRGDEPIPLWRILETNGLDDALWALRATPPEQAAERNRLARLYACDCARRTLHLVPEGEEWPACAVALAELYACGLEGVGAKELAVAAAAAGDTAGAATWSAVGAATWSAAGAATWSATWSAAEDAAWAAGAVTWAAGAAERAWQAERLRQVLGGRP